MNKELKLKLICDLIKIITQEYYAISTNKANRIIYAREWAESYGAEITIKEAIIRDAIALADELDKHI